MSTSMSVDGAHQPRDLFVTRAKLQSCQRPPNLLTELSEFRELSRILTDDPLLALRHLLKVARHLCNAGSASVSLLRYDAEGRGIVFWEVISGALAAYEGTGILKSSSPCGLCLGAETTIRVSRPERAYSGLRDIQPSIIEGLVVPLYDNARKPLGTLWIAHHDHTSIFSSDDARILEQLAVQAVLAITLLERSRERRHAANLLEAYHRTQRDLFEHDLRQERALREHAEESAKELRRVLALKESAIQEAHHRVKNTLQVAASVLSLQARATASEPVRMALRESQGRLQLLSKAHELLCASVSSRQSILMPALLDTLSNALRQSFAEMSSRVTLQVMAEPLTLPADQGIAVALLANEVITNAYKHAFPNESRGEITVALYLMSSDAMILRITDDGIGLHGDFMHGDFKGGGIGLELVRNFAAQLGGVLTVFANADTRGTVMTLTMRPPARRKRCRADPSPDATLSKPS